MTPSRGLASASFATSIVQNDCQFRASGEHDSVAITHLGLRRHISPISWRQASERGLCVRGLLEERGVGRRLRRRAWCKKEESGREKRERVPDAARRDASTPFTVRSHDHTIAASPIATHNGATTNTLSDHNSSACLTTLAFKRPQIMGRVEPAVYQLVVLLHARVCHHGVVTNVRNVSKAE